MWPPGGAAPVEKILFPQAEKMKFPFLYTPYYTHPLLLETDVLFLSGSSPCGDNVMSVGSSLGHFPHSSCN